MVQKRSNRFVWLNDVRLFSRAFGLRRLVRHIVRNMTNFGVWFEISNDIQIKSEYANNTFAISAAIEKMQMKIDSASDEIEKQLEEFEASIDAKSQELEDNLQEQCKKCKDLGRVPSKNDRNHRSLSLTLN